MVPCLEGAIRLSEVSTSLQHQFKILSRQHDLQKFDNIITDRTLIDRISEEAHIKLVTQVTRVKQVCNQNDGNGKPYAEILSDLKSKIEKVGALPGNENDRILSIMVYELSAPNGLNTETNTIIGKFNTHLYSASSRIDMMNTALKLNPGSERILQSMLNTFECTVESFEKFSKTDFKNLFDKYRMNVDKLSNILNEHSKNQQESGTSNPPAHLEQVTAHQVTAHPASTQSATSSKHPASQTKDTVVRTTNVHSER